MTSPVTRADARPARPLRAGLVLTTAAALVLAGCNGNYKSSDDEYRPLGDPHAQQQRDD